MRSAAQEARLWRLLVRVRAVRLRRKLRTLVDARRRERHAAAAVAEQLAALERHAEERQRVLAFCRRDQRAGGQWHATLRAHDGRTSMLYRQLSEARRTHALAHDEARQALREWNVERVRHDDAKHRWRVAVARVACGARDGR
jgi:septal ring factor EnvC (AmiA/AmiB activator)